MEQPNALEELRKFVSVYDPNVSLSDLLALAQQKVLNLSRAQDEALTKLERGLD